MNENELNLKVDEIMELMHNHYESNTYYQSNEGIIKVLLFDYVNHNGDCERLKIFLDDPRNIHYLQDKNILYFIEALVNVNNDYDITMEQEVACFDVLLDVSKNYMDSSRGKVNLYDNPVISLLVDLYVKCNYFMSLYSHHS